MSDLFLDEVIRPEPGSNPARSARRADREDRDRKRRKRRRRTIIALVVSLAVLAGAAYAVVQVAGGFLEDLTSSGEEPATDFPGPGVGSTQIEIPQGATGTDMAQILHDAGVVASPRAFTRAFAANASAANIQPGTYELALEMKASDAVSALLDPAKRVQSKVTIPEGRNVVQILEKLSSVTAVPVEEFQAAMQDQAAMGLPAEAGGSYEGWLFPDTYSFEPGTTPGEMVQTMIARMVQVLDERGVAPQDRQAVLIKASLVERESPDPEASPKMARAIENRLERGMPLQIDAAVAYGLNKPGTELTLDDISPDATDNPYNTYAHAGLPPTPIASPGAASIDAVLSPEEGPWLFWVAINLDTGETRFAETYEEHRQNEALLREWQAQQE